MNISNLFSELSTLERIFLSIIIFLIITYILGWYMKRQESIEINLETFSNFKEFSNKNLYDSFYAKAYDSLFLSDLKNEFEIYNIKQLTIDEDKYWSKNDSAIHFLDLGCGTGNHIKIIRRYGYNVEGIDKSPEMTKKAREQNPGTEIITADILDKNAVPINKYSHITCFFFTIYYLDEIDNFFNNCSSWLLPKGYLCLHLVNTRKFDPVLEKVSSLIPFYNPQKHTKTRNTKSKLIFNEFTYISDWIFPKEKDDREVYFIENFISKNGGDMRKNKHKLFMHPQKFYYKIAKKYGFELHKVIDLTPVNHRDNYIYIFKKNK
jgi:SAM-dependent methyltransferase